GCNLVGIARAAHAHIDTPAAEDVESGRLGSHVQGMVHGQQDDAEAQAHRGGVLADRGKHHLGGAAVGPFREEVVLDEPDALKPHLLGEPHLIDNLPYALVFRFRRGRSGHLYLIEQTESHAVFPLSEVHNTYTDSVTRGSPGWCPWETF